MAVSQHISLLETFLTYCNRSVLFIKPANAQIDYYTPVKASRCKVIWCVLPLVAYACLLTSLYAALDYRLAPETRFPGPLHDAVSAYFRLVDDLHISPENIIISGDSAGGGLSLALMMYLRDNDYPLPGGAILMSPWVGKCLSPRLNICGD